jgi:hypothetical protein
MAAESDGCNSQNSHKGRYDPFWCGQSLNKRSKIEMAKKHYPKGLDGRQRDADGEIRKKRSDTLMGTLRKEYGSRIPENYRADTKLGTVLKREGVETLDQLLKKK